MLDRAHLNLKTEGNSSQNHKLKQKDLINEKALPSGVVSSREATATYVVHGGIRAHLESNTLGEGSTPDIPIALVAD